MKNIFTFFLFTAISAQIFAQGPAKKYVLMEHFTNSKCSVCASKNPSFYTIINSATNAPNIHHLSIHPSTPYASCTLYLANTVENQALANFYNVVGTPRVFVNGTATTGSALITQAVIDAAAAETSPVIVRVAETAAANGSTDVKVTIKTVDAAGISGDFRLYVAVAEKTINLTSPTSLEPVHHDVFRDMLTSTDGMAITLPALGQSAEYTFNFTPDASWNAGDLFVTAYIRNPATKAILQSGTRFDPVVLDVAQTIENQSISIFPNPATDEITLAADHIIIESVDVFNTAGELVSTQKEGLGSPKVRVKTDGLTSGVYFTKTKTRTGTTFGKFVKH